MCQPCVEVGRLSAAHHAGDALREPVGSTDQWVLCELCVYLRPLYLVEFVRA
jgi:hypothetical protein